MSQRVVDAKIDFYTPGGSLRYSLTSHIRKIQISESATDQADDAGFELAHDFANLANFVVGDECRVYVKLDTDVSLTQIWTGVVDSISSRRHGPAFADLPIKAQDFVYWTLAHVYITDSYSNQAAGAIVRAILTNYVPSIDSTNVEDTTTTVPSIVFNGESALSCIRRIAQFANAMFKGDLNKKLYFYAKGTKSSGKTVDPSGVVRDTFSVETAFSDFGNVVTVTGGKKKVADSASAGGAFSSWSTITSIVRKKAQVFFSKSRVSRVGIWTNPSVPSSLTGGITVRIQANNAAGTAPVAEADANFDLASFNLPVAKLTVGGWTYFDLPDYIGPAGNNCWVIVESDANSQRVGLDGGGALMWLTYFDLPIIVQKSDNPSIATYGRRELQPVANANIATDEEADALATRILVEHKDPVITGSYEVGMTDAVDVANAILVRYKLDETSGTVATDSGPNAANGTIAGTPALGAAGQIGTSITFDGVNDAVTFTPPTALSGTTTIAISAWFKLGADGTNSGASQAIFAYRPIYLHARGATNDLTLRFSDGVAARTVAYTLGAGDRAWHHAFGMYIWENGQARLELWVDGTLRATGAFAAGATVDQSGLIGKSGTTFFTGNIDECRAYSRALTASEIAWLYAEGLAGRSSTTQTGLRSVPVGQTVSATFTADGINASTALIVTRKQHDYNADAGTYSLQHEFVSAARELSFEDFVRTVYDRLKNLEDKASPTPILYLVTSTNDVARVADTVTATEATTAASNWVLGTHDIGFNILG